MNTFGNAFNLLNSIKSYTLNNISSQITAVSTFSSVPLNGAPNSDDSDEIEIESENYIVCGESACGSELVKTKEICSRE